MFLNRIVVKIGCHDALRIEAGAVCKSWCCAFRVKRVAASDFVVVQCEAFRAGRPEYCLSPGTASPSPSNLGDLVVYPEVVREILILLGP